MDCLIVGYAEPSRNRERQQFYSGKNNLGTGFRRYLHLNYVDFDGDFILPNHLASLAHLRKVKSVGDGLPGALTRDKDGGFDVRDLNHYSTWNMPLLGGLYLYQHLRKQGHDVALIKHAQMEWEEFQAHLARKPKVIAISTTLLLHPLDIGYIVKVCRDASPDSFIILGGATTTTSYMARGEDHKHFGIYLADAVVLDSKGAKALARVVEKVKKGESLDDIPNLLLFDRNDRSKIAKRTQKLPESFDFHSDALDWDQVEDKYLDNITWLQTQVSCPFACNFCSYPVVQGEVKKSDLATVTTALEKLHARGVRHLLFVDDTFNVPKARFIEFMKVLKRFDFTWTAYIRCQFLDAAQVKLMKESGCGGAYLGIESAHPDVLLAMNKASKPEDYWRGVALLKDAGITTYGSFLIGFPGETPESIATTTKFIQESGLDYYNIKCFYYDHSTPIHKLAGQYDLKGSMFHWSHNTMNADQAFDAIQNIIKTTDTVFIPQHSGEIWELAYFRSLGFSEAAIKKLYATFTDMMKQNYNGVKRSPEQERLILSSLESLLAESHVSDEKSAS